ncbi:MAG: hypothetical protein ACO3DX_01870 [Candidatus Nanopelagicales bacterium]
MSFNSLRNRMFIVVTLGVFLGGLIGAPLGRASNAQWGDLIGAITGIWLGGPIAALLTFQVLIAKLNLDVSVTRARLANVILSFFSATMLLFIFASLTRIGSATILVAPVIIGANILFSYLNLVGSIRVASK